MIEGKSVPKIPSFKQRSVHHAALLGFMATITGALVVIGNVETQDLIEQRYAEDIKASLSQVILPGTYNNDILKDNVVIKYHAQDKKVYQAKIGNKVVAAAFQMTGNGYAGPIKLIMGVKNNGELLGVRILAHSETPGLGDKIEEKKSHWIFNFDKMSFAKLNPDMWKVKKDKGYFDQFTGATITPRAVVKSIKEGMDFFQDHRAEILQEVKSAAKDKAISAEAPTSKAVAKDKPQDSAQKKPTEVRDHDAAI